MQPIQDYRKLNTWTRKNWYPLPLITELVNKVPGNNWYSTMDVRYRHNNVLIKDGDQWKAAFKTNKGLFKPLVMFYGLTNSPSTFQKMMDDIFREELTQGWIKIYMDDILIATSGTREEHLERVTQVLKKLHDHDLFLKPEKCKFARQLVNYLGVIIGKEGVKMDLVKLNGIINWPTPTMVTEVQSFLGFGNFYKPFIADYTKIAHPLHNLTKKGVVFQWMEKKEASFQKLKERFTSRPVLATINMTNNLQCRQMLQHLPLVQH
jgi:hypothetical protein